MTDTTTELPDSFVAVAIRHQLLEPQQAAAIIEKADQEKTDQSDAALSLSYLTPQEVDAVELLMQPTAVAPGYELTELIGCGAVGIVFRAEQSALNRDVAIKTISLKGTPSETSPERIRREAHAIARLKHPNIVAAYDSVFSRGRLCIALELIDGEDLGTFVERSGRLSEGTAWRIARQIAAALAHANAAGIIHRDVKPANILLTKPPAGSELKAGVPLVKVADFGLAFEFEENDQSNLTAAGTTLGTPAYVAPEQLRNTHVDARADIYSLGATVFHMLSGTAPIVGLSVVQAVVVRASGDQSWREDLPDGLSRETIELFRDMTENDPERRIADYESLIARIDEVLAVVDPAIASSETTPTAPRPSAAGPPSRETPFPVWRNRKIAYAASILLAVAAGIWASLSDERSTVNPPSEVPLWEVQGVPQPLFDGQSVPRYTQSGSWVVDQFTLVGSENGMMTIPLDRRSDGVAGYRFGVSVSLKSGDSAEIVPPHPVQAGSSEHPTTVSILLEDESASVVDTKGQPDSSRSVVGGSKQAVLRPGSPEEDARQVVQVYRQANDLVLIVNGARLAQLSCTSTTNNEVTLKVNRGKASFADIEIADLVKEE